MPEMPEFRCQVTNPYKKQFFVQNDREIKVPPSMGTFGESALLVCPSLRQEASTLYQTDLCTILYLAQL